MSSWFDTKSFASLAKSALSQAQKQIDKALEAVADEESDSDDSEGLSSFMNQIRVNKTCLIKPFFAFSVFDYYLTVIFYWYYWGCGIILS